MPGGSFSTKRITDAVTRSDDAFGKRIADGTVNELDIASQYDFSPERVRLLRNGSREFPQYNSVAQFTDAADVWTLQPDAGDAMHVESAESVTYVVNYVIQASFSFQTNQPLAAGDVLRVGPYNGTDGWVFEQRGADHAADEGDIIGFRGGTETTLAAAVTLERPITDWTRLEVRYNWYNVGNQTISQTYTVNGTQCNDVIAQTSIDGGRGPETGNLNLWQGIQADASTTGLELDAGSMGAITLGTPTALTRAKPQFTEVTLAGAADTWEPFYAIRVAPSKSPVNAQFTTLDILNYAANATVELLVVSVDPSKTDASGWSDPDYHHPSNSALQSTTSVSEVPNTSGTQTDLGSGEKPGGHTIAAAVDVDGGIASGTAGTANATRQEKKAIPDSDHVVFLARSGTVDSTLSFVWDINQNW